MSGPARKVFVGYASASSKHGGIPHVARLSVRALMDGGEQVTAASYLDATPPAGVERIGAACNGSKLGFAITVHSSALTHAQFLYDSLGIARAHPRFAWPRRPYAVWMHGLEAWENLRHDHARVLRRATLVVANSQYTLARYQSIHGALPRGRVCWLATEQDSPGARANFTGPPTALIVGRLEATEGQKGHADLLRCWPQVVAAVPRARLVIAGAGTGLETMRAQARASSAASSIDVLGFVPDSEMPALLSNAHVFAMPSRQEGFGIVYIEAMRHGLPVIASVHDAGQEVNIDGETGFNVNLDRGSELSERLIHLLSEPGRAAAMGAAGLRRWEQHFSYSRFLLRFCSLWRAGMTE